MKKIFLFIAFIFGSISLSFAQDNWGEQGGSSGSSISGTDKDTGIFVGISYPIGTISVKVEEKPTDSSIECVNCLKTERSPAVNSSTGFRIGWQSDGHQVALASYQWQTGEGEVQNQMLIYDYIFGSGFFAGAGFGAGKFDSGKFDSTTTNSNNSKSGSGTIIGFELGYQRALGNFLQFSIGYLYTNFDYQLEKTSLHLCNRSSSSCEDYDAEVRQSVSFAGFALNLEIVF